MPNLMARQAFSWADLSWIRKDWNGPIVIKGVISGDDARRAVDEALPARWFPALTIPHSDQPPQRNMSPESVQYFSPRGPR